jgi:hypothetical protein
MRVVAWLKRPGASASLALIVPVALVGQAVARPRAHHVGGSPNPIQLENKRQGTRGWKTEDPPAGTIEGYASEVSVRPGERLHLHVSAKPGARYRIVIYRLGWYGGDGGRRISCVPGCHRDRGGAERVVPPFDPATGLLRATWPVTDVVRIGSRWTTGYYLAQFLLTSGRYAGQATAYPFVVRAPPSRVAPILIQASVNTWQAYNDWGGRSLYFNYSGVGDNHVSFDRPYGLGSQRPDMWELPLVRFLEREGYDVSYTTDADIDKTPAELLRHRLVIVNGHSEYWTKRMRDAFDRAVARGVNLAFIGANIGYTQMRYESAHRTIVVYRKPQLDPEQRPELKTVNFRDLVPPRPECELLGIAYTDARRPDSRPIHDFAVDPQALSDPWLAGTGFVSGSKLAGLVGYEWDGVIPGCAPQLRRTVFFHADGERPADTVRYTAPSGALVFSAGSLQFSWGLDPTPASESAPTTDRIDRNDPRLQQFMRNALSDLTRSKRHLTSALRSTADNPIAVENRHHGTTRWLAHPSAAGVAISGYSLEPSVLAGERLRFAISTTPRASYRVEIYRLGWYDGLGARLMRCLPRCSRVKRGISQPEAGVDPARSEEVQEHWRVTDTIAVPRAWTSGYYLAELVLTSGSSRGKASLVPFVVRSPPGQDSAVLVQAPVNTWQAYNPWGGSSLYQGPNGQKARRVSFDRPYAPGSLSTQSPLFWEYPLVRFLERNAYDVSYTTDVDTDRNPSELLLHNLVVVPGHSEYWTSRMRHAFEGARDGGVNLAFLGGNTVYWQAKYADGGRTIIEERVPKNPRPSNPADETVRFRDLIPPEPECTLTGLLWQGGGLGGNKRPGHDFTVTREAVSDRWLAGTGLMPGTILHGLVGYEWDGLSKGCVPGEKVLFHYEGGPFPNPRGYTRTFLSLNADSVRYTAPSGATVFSTGSVQFSWGLDDFARRFNGQMSLLDESGPDPRLQRFMQNVFDDLSKRRPRREFP